MVDEETFDRALLVWRLRAINCRLQWWQSTRGRRARTERTPALIEELQREAAEIVSALIIDTAGGGE